VLFVKSGKEHCWPETGSEFREHAQCLPHLYGQLNLVDSSLIDDNRVDGRNRMNAADSIRHSCSEAIESQLKDGDDHRLWQTVIQAVLADASFLCRQYRGKDEIFTEIGRCSHWWSPHAKGSWFSYKRFAWPSGYGSGGLAILGLPQFDWSLTWRWTQTESAWELIPQKSGKRPLVLRIAVPARTTRHVRAVVHTLWSPGSPTISNKKLLEGYAFEKIDDEWRFVAVSRRKGARELAEYG
jgi:hypothetical protein